LSAQLFPYNRTVSRPRSFTPDEQATWAPVAAMMELLPRRIDAQLLRDDDLTHFDYFAMAVLTRADEHTLRMSELADLTNATRPRLSHVIGRLEKRGYVVRSKASDDARGTDVRLTHEGRRKAIAATPGHVDNVRDVVLDALTSDQRAQLRQIAYLVLERLDPTGQVAGLGRGDFEQRRKRPRNTAGGHKGAEPQKYASRRKAARSGEIWSPG